MRRPCSCIVMLALCIFAVYLYRYGYCLVSWNGLIHLFFFLMVKIISDFEQFSVRTDSWNVIFEGRGTTVLPYQHSFLILFRIRFTFHRQSSFDNVYFSVPAYSRVFVQQPTQMPNTHIYCVLTFGVAGFMPMVNAFVELC